MEDFSAYLKDAGTRSFLLRFDDEKVESAFWIDVYTSKKRFIETTLLVTIFALFATSAKFMPYVSDVLSAQSISTDFMVRLFVLMPSLSISYFVIKGNLNFRFAQYTLMFNVSLCALAFSTMMLTTASKDGVLFFNLAFIHVILFSYVFLVIPICKGIPLIFLLCLIHVLIGCLLIGTVPVQVLIFYLTPCVTFYVILSYAAHAMEKSERFGFLYRRALGLEYKNRAELEGQRSKWLSMVTDFLRHELKNSLIGISSSLELLIRKNKNQDVEIYIDRARTSASFMKRLIDEASVSTSLESALSNIELESTNISRLVEIKTHEYPYVYNDSEFEFDIEDNVYALVDPDRLVQALDKLVNNAVEHSDQAHPIKIVVFRESGRIYIRVSNVGDALKDNLDIFQPMISSKAGKSDQNHGLGLFIVKRIVEAHGGEVLARGLIQPYGAEFTISVPA